VKNLSMLRSLIAHAETNRNRKYLESSYFPTPMMVIKLTTDEQSDHIFTEIITKIMNKSQSHMPVLTSASLHSCGSNSVRWVLNCFGNTEA
jgi:hypothetical protein